MKPRTLRLIIMKSTTGSQGCVGSWLAATTRGSIGEPSGHEPVASPSALAAKSVRS